jgi:CheY-like chemotaxis protein
MLLDGEAEALARKAVELALAGDAAELKLCLRHVVCGNNVPAIMITATTDPRVERRAGELGIRRVLKKPLFNQVLLGAIREELG